MKKNVIKTAGFLILAVLILGRINNVLAFKYGDGIYQFDVFYEQPKDSIDVMCSVSYTHLTLPTICSV